MDNNEVLNLQTEDLLRKKHHKSKPQVTYICIGGLIILAG